MDRTVANGGNEQSIGRNSMDKKPFFSIIIPVYNVAPYLRECLDSVLAQTFTDWEAICVDDGSTDESGAILDEYAAKDKRFRVIHKTNGGVSSARNTGLDAARGDWIGFLDADDILAHDWLIGVFDACEGGIDWIRTGWTDWDAESGMKKVRKACCNDDACCECGQKVAVVGWCLISHCAFSVVNFYRKELVGSIRYINGIRMREDALFCYELALRSKVLKIIPSTGYIRRIHSGSVCLSHRRRDDTTKLLDCYLSLWQRNKDRMPKNSKEKRKMIAASTFWVCKDLKEWFTLCENRSVSDGIRVWQRVCALLVHGAISASFCGTIFDKLRWLIYLSTGIGRILLINRLNVLRRN